VFELKELLDVGTSARMPSLLLVFAVLSDTSLLDAVAATLPAPR
jgi:hypothetical protein